MSSSQRRLLFISFFPSTWKWLEQLHQDWNIGLEKFSLILQFLRLFARSQTRDHSVPLNIIWDETRTQSNTFRLTQWNGENVAFPPLPRHFTRECTFSYLAEGDEYNWGVNDRASSGITSSTNAIVSLTETNPICSLCSDGWARILRPALFFATNFRSLLGCSCGFFTTFCVGGCIPCGDSFTSTL